MSDRFRTVAVGQVCSDERPVSALAERVGLHCRQRGQDGTSRLLAIHQSARQRFQGVQPKVPEPLTLRDNPPLIPAGQKLGLQIDRAEPVRNARTVAVDQGEREGLEIFGVNGDGVVEADRSPLGPQDPTAMLRQTPDCGAKIRRRSRLRLLGPQ